ncbi:LysR family transcriptional regulator [Catenovulum sp. 2E275]|uniref:LysR family transcriptional regulator n=1 Tax=Catenovulum sp. 2E275 TaxID=2980497 RepID=UPI0021CF4AAB|nr:LysR family transcriptional regulator [Catenovulum sp. 2E275]MCU4675686.1 LysR family transcriptional regulator [Catenovulum sp. 2E275]
MLPNINLNLLRSLHILLHEAHVSRAAQRLYITQSALSRQLSQLRELCRDELLVRQGNQLVLTPKAEQLKLKLDALFNEFEHILEDSTFDPANWQGELVISSSDYIAQYVLPDICARLSEQAPELKITYRLWQPNYIGQLHEQGIDIASTILPEKPAGVSSTYIGQDKSVVVMSKLHPLAVKSKLTLKEFIQYPHIKITGGADKDSGIELKLTQLNLKRHIMLQVPFFSAAISRLQSTQFLMVIPLHIAKHLELLWPIIYRDLPFELDSHQYWLVWHSKFDNDIAHKWAREQIVDTLQNNQHSIHLDD